MLYTFVLDLKLTPAGEVKILEVQDTLQSGSTGYEQAYGKCIMRDDILPFYEKTFGLPVFSVDDRITDQNRELGAQRLLYLTNWNKSLDCYKKAAALPKKDNFDPDNIATHSAIMMPWYFQGYYSNHTRAEQKEQVAVVNDHRLFIAATDSKFLQHLFFNPLIGDLAPESAVTRVTTPAKMAKDIKAAITADKIVLKLPEAARAEAVIITDRDKLEDVLTFLTEKPSKDSPRAPDQSLSSYFNHRAWNHGQWAHKQMIVAQSLEQSVPVVNQQDGKTYDPTMRVFASVWQEDGNTHCEVHGGYWKFPQEPVAKNTSSKHLISASPTKKSGGKVAPEHMEAVTKQLQAVLPSAFETLDGMKITDSIRSCLKSQDDLRMHAILRYTHLAADRAVFEELTEQEAQAFGTELAAHDLRCRNFISYNDKTKRPACLLASKRNTGNMKHINDSYIAHIHQNRHLLPKNHALYKAQKPAHTANTAKKKNRKNQ